AYPPSDWRGVLAATSICFDLSVFEIFGGLSGGGSVVVVGDALGLIESRRRQEVTLINTVPSVMAELVGVGRLPGGVRAVNLAGEALSQGLVERVYAAGAE